MTKRVLPRVPDAAEATGFARTTEVDDTTERVLYRIPDVVAVTGFARTTVFAVLASGELPSFKVGRNRYVHRDVLAAYIRRLAGLDDVDARRRDGRDAAS